MSEAGKQIRDALLENNGLMELDVRLCGIEEEVEQAIGHILTLRKENSSHMDSTMASTGTGLGDG